MKKIVGKNGLQILTFWRSLQTGKMCSSSRNGDRQTANAGNVGSRDPLCRSREKKYAVLNLSITHHVYGKRRTKICVFPKMEETRLIRHHFLAVSSRYQVNIQKRETSYNMT